MRLYAWMLATLLTLSAMPARAGVVDSPLPAPFTQHVFTVSGIARVAFLGAFFSCTNLDAVSVTIGVEMFSTLGNVINDAAAESLTLIPGQTALWGTSLAVNMTVDSAISGYIASKHSARILATSKKIACDAFMADYTNGPPTSGWPLTVIAKTKQKAAN
jgi:hypothetical protein